MEIAVFSIVLTDGGTSPFQIASPNLAGID